MPRGASVGIAAELAVAAELIVAGYMVGSRRHIPGAGDLLAVGAGHSRPLLLVEVKATSEVPWRSRFTPERRRELRDLAGLFHAIPLLAWRPPGLGGTVWLEAMDWPR